MVDTSNEELLVTLIRKERKTKEEYAKIFELLNHYRRLPVGSSST
jgi:hypothetical protein